MTGTISSFRLILVRSAALLVSLASATGLRAVDPARYAGVTDWKGRLQISLDGAGEIDNGVEGKTTYDVHQHLDFPFELKGAGGSWYTCRNQLALGQVHNVYVSTQSSGGCTLTITEEASGVLVPFPSIGPPPFDCIGTGAFELLIAGAPGNPASPYTAIVFVTDILGDQTVHLEGAPCQTSDATDPAPYSILPLDIAVPNCPGPNCLHLVEEKLDIVQSWNFDAPFYGPSLTGTVGVNIALDLHPCGGNEDLEVVIVTPDGYDSWRPEGRGSETEKGNGISVRARLQKRGGGTPCTKVKRFIFDLVDVSAEPGVCMNWPHGQSSDPADDLQFLDALNPSPWLSGSPLQRLTEDGSYTESPLATVSSFDWGGSGALEVTAILEDDSQLTAHLDVDETKSQLPLPKRRAGSRIADVWRRSFSDANVLSLADDDDGESDPEGDGHTGDGLTLFEEYRGFYKNTALEHLGGDPKKKDLFVIDDLGSEMALRLFSAETGLRLSLLADLSMTEERVLNFKVSLDSPHRVSQHAIHLRPGQLSAAKGGAFELGRSEGGPGLPRDVSVVAVSTRLTPNGSLPIAVNGVTGRNDFLHTLLHELLHACNVYHHGERDEIAHWTVAEVPGPQGNNVLQFQDEAGKEVILKSESETYILPTDPADVGKTLEVWVGLEGKLHSGVEDCVLRYDAAKAYPAKHFAGIYYFLGLESHEPGGFRVCGSPIGTGVNDPNPPPAVRLQPRYFDATVGCCKGQICINDDHHGDHPPATPPSGHPAHCPAAGGGALPGGGAVPGGGGVDPAPVIALRVNEARAATIDAGWPLLLAVELSHPEFGGDAAAATPITLLGSGPTWRSAVRLEVADGAGQPVAWPLLPANEPLESLILDANQGGQAAWWVRPEETSSIAPGSYRVTPVLDTTGASEGWIGIERGEPALVTVAAAPLPLPPDREASRDLFLARYRILCGELDAAAALVDALLALAPESLAGWGMRAYLLEEAGENDEALAACRRALEIFDAEDPDAQEPPAGLLERLDSLQSKTIHLTEAPAGPVYRRGDVNLDGSIDIGDAIAIIFAYFLGGAAQPGCVEAADVNDDGAVDLSDTIGLLEFFFLSGPSPAVPFPSCGRDPSPDPLGCANFPVCPR